MPNQPYFSIITVVYNDADNLEKTINSVKSQSCKDYEYIVIDGGSTDKTIEVIRNFESSITHWQSQADKGIYDAMNKGIAAAKGKYLHFLNAGDIYHQNDVLERIYKGSNKIACDIVYGKTLYQSDSSHILKGTKVNFYNLYFSIPFCHQSVFFSKSIFKTTGAYDLKYKYAADYAWMCKYFNHSKSFDKVQFINIPVSIYLDGGISFVNMEKVLTERIDIARNHFPAHAYLAFMITAPFVFIKFKLIKLMGKLEILDHYRKAKNFLSTSSSSNL